ATGDKRHLLAVPPARARRQNIDRYSLADGTACRLSRETHNARSVFERRIDHAIRRGRFDLDRDVPGRYQTARLNDDVSGRLGDRGHHLALGRGEPVRKPDEPDSNTRLNRLCARYL